MGWLDVFGARDKQTENEKPSAEGSGSSESLRRASPISPESITFQPLVPSFHPHLSFDVTTNSTTISSIHEDCIFNIEVVLPDALFVDQEEIRGTFPYEWRLTPEVIDIERPVRSDAKNPLSIFSLVLGPGSELKRIYEVDVPLHVRYLKPNEAGHETLRLFGGGEEGQLNGGWKCGPPDDEVTLPRIPIEPLDITLPTGRPSHQSLVELGTTVAVWTCFAYLAHKVWKVSRRTSEGSRSKMKAS